MKIGLVCEDRIREDVAAKVQELGVELYASADVYLVQEGLHQGLLPCIVFHPDNLDGLVDLLHHYVGKSVTSKVTGMLNDAYYILPHEDILYFEALDAVVLCHTSEETYHLKERLFQLENRLPGDQFVRVSRSFIVQINAVTKVIPWFNRRLLLTFAGSKKEVEVSKSYVKSFKAFLGMR
ncbi:hypothetical protein GLW00_06665 [Halobacillus litoralis]|uniref:HTH LytTR-type domain-containing protein n=1 Tax=Halobacillus litoralis TaxID=45668 RepID=A0A845F878_9BACI|nr:MULTISPECIES: LytTR family DNA-binding domain-containing protein [Halobacillus]MEC3885783.1 LytTR family DNA-binding domain-containing protein [Halobacillus sp. HZG1]MYL70522.1 hypothetical protein [Halobacillus litoralis]